tara:strand:+ start:476 stop:1090 length:615 start_codon:yes stop_codon:yes gene_type:complete
MSFVPVIHKVNSLSELEKIPKNYGVEIDIRIESGTLCLSHDPIKNFKDTTRLDNFLSEYEHMFIVANIKDSGIEDIVIEKLKKYTENFFLLDFEIPYLFNKDKNKNKYLSVRYSHFEKIEKNSKILNYVDWLWVDTFEKFPINDRNLSSLPELKKCLVSPERWGRKEDINKIAQYLKNNNLNFELIMTNLTTVNDWKLILDNKK